MSHFARVPGCLALRVSCRNLLWTRASHYSTHRFPSTSVQHLESSLSGSRTLGSYSPAQIRTTLQILHDCGTLYPQKHQFTHLSDALNLSVSEILTLLRKIRNLLRDPSKNITKEHRARVRAFLLENEGLTWKEALEGLNGTLDSISKEQLRGLINFEMYKMRRVALDEEMRRKVCRIVDAYFDAAEEMPKLCTLYDEIEAATQLPRIQIIRLVRQRVESRRYTPLTQKHRATIEEVLAEPHSSRDELLKTLRDRTGLSRSQLSVYLCKRLASSKSVSREHRRIVEDYVSAHYTQHSAVQMRNALQKRIGHEIPRLQMYMLVIGAMRKARRRIVTAAQRDVIREVLQSEPFVHTIRTLRDAQDNETLFTELHNKTQLPMAQLNELITQTLQSQQKRRVTAQDRFLVQEFVSRFANDEDRLKMELIKLREDLGLNASQMNNLVRHTRKQMK